MTLGEELEQKFSELVKQSRTRRLTGREWRYLELLAFFIRRAQANAGPTSEEELRAMGYGRGPAERTPSVHVMSVPPVPPPRVPESLLTAKKIKKDRNNAVRPKEEAVA
jgi:hypothetical protein